MKFLIDNSLSPELSRMLNVAGHDSVHLRDLGLESAPDEVVLETATSLERTLISADSDFGRMLASAHGTTASVVLLREGKPYEPAEQVELLTSNLARIRSATSAPSVIVFKDGRLRVRRFPASDS